MRTRPECLGQAITAPMANGHYVGGHAKLTPGLRETEEPELPALDRALKTGQILPVVMGVRRGQAIG
jgi:hypothetical protein